MAICRRFLVVSLVAVLGMEGLVFAQPGVGSIYREYKRTMGGQKDWRVTDPESPQAGAKAFLPNSVLSITIDDLEGAIAAEAVFDRWGGHTGTVGQKVRFNRGQWYNLPLLTTVPAGHVPEAYQFQDNPVITIDLTDLHEGDNTFEGTSGGQTCYDFDWGQWGWDGVVIRVYYGASKRHVTGRISSLKAGDVLGEDPVLSVATSDDARVARVDFVAYYEGVDEDGDGHYLDWHEGYFCERDAETIDISGHCGTALSAPWQVDWDTRYVPDQAGGTMKIVARIMDKAGIWYVTEAVAGLGLARDSDTVKLYRAKDVPEKFWSRLGEVKACKIKMSEDRSAGKAIEATLHWRTWNGQAYTWTYGNYSSTFGAGNHNFAYTINRVPVEHVKRGESVVSVVADTEHHGVEVCWPGPGLVVRYEKADSNARQIAWTHVSTTAGELAIPNEGSQQTATLVLDVDRDGVQDFVVTERTQSPSVVWYRFNGSGWDRSVIERAPLHIEAGGDYHDIDGDGDLDIHFCGDSQDDSAWWWENPYPDYSSGDGWTRRLIKSGDNARYQHDSVFGDFDGDNGIELVWWSQTASKLMLAEMPDDPKGAIAWPYSVIMEGVRGEGIGKADVNLDGKVDIVGGGMWFEHRGGTVFKAHSISERRLVRCVVGQLIAGGRVEVVMGPGDGTGPLEWFEWKGDRWVSHELRGFVDHGHSMALADFDRDGRLDIFTAEMRLNNDNPKAKAWVYFNNGDGTFEEEVVVEGFGWHESRAADLDGDGDVDLLGKPYNWEAPRLDIWLNQSVR